MSRRRLFLIPLITVSIFGLIFVGWSIFQPGSYAFAGGQPIALSNYEGPSPTGVPPELAHADARTRGEYVTRMADCEACHTAKEGRPFAGGRAFVLPFGTIYTPNITPDPDTGIGRWSDAQFLKAVHRGVSANGSRLYAAFPFASYTLLTDEDVLAIKAYLFSLAPVRQDDKPNTFVFPFNQRWLMAFWSAFFNRDQRFRPIRERSPTWNRGAYLVEAAGHCGECHTPRNLFQAMNQREKFAGGTAEGWSAYNITGDPISGVGAWSTEELAGYLAGGHVRGRGAASGPMGEAVDLSLSKLTASDIGAIVTYVRSVKPIRSEALPAVAPAASDLPKVASAQNGQGKRVFEGNCASCHAWSGAGVLVNEAQLTGVRAVNDVSAINVVQMILGGSASSQTAQPTMPAFAAVYSDAEIAAVANYVTVRFGAEPSRATPKQVALLRLQR